MISSKILDKLTWQPAIILPVESMCPLHRALFDTISDEDKVEKLSTIGDRVRVTPSDKVLSIYTGRSLPTGECQPILVRHPVRGVCGAFSCEVSTD